MKEGFNEVIDKITMKPKAYAESQVKKGAALKAKADAQAYQAGKALGQAKIGKAAESGFSSLGTKLAGHIVTGWGKVLQGVFNDPEWYSYHGWSTNVAFNASRPFDPINLKHVQGRLGATPASGVTHVIQQNLVFTDVKDSEAFKLATIEAFREIRLDLKSNLLYTQQQYDSYVAWVLAIAVKAYAIERTLGLVNKTRPDIPEFQKAIGSVTANYSEFGKVAPVPIAMISDENYAKSLADYKKLESIVRMIQIPEKLNQFAKWWVGGLFIDQSAPNPQIYANMLRSCPIYSSTTNGELIQIGSFDILNGQVSDLVSECTDLLTVFGVLNADITKTGRYGSISIEDVTDNYLPKIYTDYEFFSVLVNSYMNPSTDETMTANINQEYVRVDFLNELSNQNTVGVCNALAPWADVVVPLRIVSQAAYFTGDASQRSTRNVNTIYSLAPDPNWTNGYAYIHSSTDMFIQVTGNMDVVQHIATTASASTFYKTYTPSAKYLGTPVITPLSMELGTVRAFSEVFDRMGLGYGHIIGSYSDNGTKKYVLIGIQDNKAYYFYGATDSKLSSAQGRVEVEGAEVTEGVNSQGYAYYSIIVRNGSFTTIPAEAFPAFLGIFTVGSELTANYLSTLSVTYTAADINDCSVELIDTLTLASFCEQVDYHIPMYVRQRWIIREVSTNSRLQVWGLYHLLKECYIPAILSKADVKAVLYWMYLGLFSMDKTRVPKQ